jgi:hypothetical protein
LVPEALPFAVPLDGSGVLLAIPPPVIRMSGTPLLRAVAAHLAVFRVRGNLLAVILGATAALAVGAAAHQLPRLVFRWLEGVPAKAASPFAHNGGCRIL